jgi:hypothetical protein
LVSDAGFLNDISKHGTAEQFDDMYILKTSKLFARNDLPEIQEYLDERYPDIMKYILEQMDIEQIQKPICKKLAEEELNFLKTLLPNKKD